MRAGNIYVNRNIIGAVVGVQPFGGEGLSGTGPKAGGPLYVRRLLAGCPPRRRGDNDAPPLDMAPLIALRDWLSGSGGLGGLGDAAAARLCSRYLETSPLRGVVVLAGPTGEQDTYELRPRGRVLCLAQTGLGALAQLGATLATGNTACFVRNDAASTLIDRLPASIAALATLIEDPSRHPDGDATPDFTAALVEGAPSTAASWARFLAQREGPIVTPQCLSAEEIASGVAYSLDWLVTERSISINTAAAGGNASLMTIG